MKFSNLIRKVFPFNTAVAEESGQDNDELDNIVSLTNENGKDEEFEFLDVVEYNDKEYVILLPVADREAGAVVIFRVEGEGEDESYVGLESQEEAEAVFEIFKTTNQDTFNFID